jgi:D-galactonate transporter
MSTSHDAMDGVKSNDEQMYKKVTWRLMPFLMCCYLVAYLDRVNIGFAKLQMANDLGLSETAYGLGAGLFFIGYFFFEVPSNIIMHRVGARIWIARIMITWGVLSACFAFISTPWHFYVLRFLLGVAEAGFSPGVLLYLTYWYPAARRGKATALYFLAIPLSSVVGGPISGWIMSHMQATHGMHSWQWLFILEAIPAVILGLLALAYLDRNIKEARWLTPVEKAHMGAALAADDTVKAVHGSVRSFLADKQIWVLSGSYFCCVMGIYALAFWVPTLIRSTGVTDTFNIGLLSAIPNFVAVIAIYLSGASADRRKDRRRHFMIAMLIGALGLSLAALGPKGTGFAVMSLSIGAAGILSATSLFWAFPGAILMGVAAAASIALVNCVGNLAGFVSPYMVGWLNDTTHNPAYGMVGISIFLALGALVALWIPQKSVDR